MAGLDYLTCDKCGERLYYMPESIHKGVVCKKCYDKVVVKYEKLYKKHYKTIKGLT